MGGGPSYSYDLHTKSVARARSTGYKDTFIHTTDIRAGKTSAGTHKDLDPKLIKDSVTGFRESRDSVDTPNSTAVAIFIDVTGSMHSVPKELFQKLPTLMGVLTKHGAPTYPQVLFGAVGDVKYDDSPLQVGQFESSNKMESDLSKFYLEGGGGANSYESYDQVLYFLARKTVIDCFEKRREKGYAFLVCDENPPDICLKSEIAQVFGDNVQEDIPIQTLINEVLEKYNFFLIRPSATSNGANENITKRWEKLLPQRIIKIENTSEIIEAIALKIAFIEGIDLKDIEDDLINSGTSSTSLAVLKNELIKSITPKDRRDKAVSVGKKISGGGRKVVKF